MSLHLWAVKKFRPTTVDTFFKTVRHCHERGHEWDRCLRFAAYYVETCRQRGWSMTVSEFYESCVRGRWRFEWGRNREHYLTAAVNVMATMADLHRLSADAPAQMTFDRMCDKGVI